MFNRTTKSCWRCLRTTVWRHPVHGGLALTKNARCKCFKIN